MKYLVTLFTLLLVTGQILAAEEAVPDSSVDKKLPRLLELGSDKCKSCKKMAVVLDEIKEKYGDGIAIEKIDVKKNPGLAREYKIQLIPTQIFLDSTGVEFYRHTGYLPADEIEQVLQKMGVSP